MASSKATTGIYWLVKRNFNALPNRGEQMDILHKLSKLEKKKHWCIEYLGLCL